MNIAKRGINNKIDWKMIHHMSGSKYHSALYRSEFMGKKIQCEKHTPVLRDYGGPKDFGEPEIYFFIDDDEREFKTQKELINTILNEV